MSVSFMGCEFHFKILSSMYYKETLRAIIFENKGKLLENWNLTVVKEHRVTGVCIQRQET